MWTEVYRPKTFEEVSGQKEIVDRLKAFVDQKNLPHLLFAGPAGVGKSTLSLIITKELFGVAWRENFLELNASDTRGIDVVRGVIKDFARTKSLSNVPFKIIFLDECDSLTKDAQQALRRTMETYASSTRFILGCITPDTKILLPNEIEITIDDFMKKYSSSKQKDIQNVSEYGKEVKRDLVLASIKLSPKMIGKRVFEITTMSGRKIKATEDHKFLTTTGWKETKCLKEDDNILIYPSLEGTYYEEDSRRIVDIEEFINFISYFEGDSGLGDIKNVERYKQLKNKEKRKIIKRIEELTKILNEKKGLTEREYEIYILIKQLPLLSGKEIGERLNLSRIRTMQLLKSIELKGHIERIILSKKEAHKFKISNTSPLPLRNYMDIKKIIQKEFNINISYSAVKEALKEGNCRGKVDRILGELKRRGLLDLTFNDLDKMGALARICGFMLGDGHLTKNNIRLFFSGNKKALCEVKKDLEILGYKNHSGITSKKLENVIRGRTFQGVSTSFYLDSSALSIFLQFLGIPKGDKVITEFGVPRFIKEGTKFVKREFLRALFGCDADKPTCKKINFEAVALRQNKAKNLSESITNYYNEISNLFKEFNIETYLEIKDKKEIRKKDNFQVLTFGLIIKPNNFNLFKFFSRIGYAYEGYKIRLARASSEYLRHKLHLINSWKRKSKLIISQTNSLKTITETARDFEVTPDFVRNQIKGKDVHLPRKKFTSFKNWIEKYQFNNLLLNKIENVEEIDSEVVMDLTCHKDHNFIANGFISHNCNYSSRIIDPIISRCAVFRFKLLKKEDIFNLIDKIAKKEGITLDENSLEALYVLSKGDARRAINVMQSSAAISKKVTQELIYDLVSAATPQEIKSILETAVSGDFISARTKLFDTMLKRGLSGLDIIRQIQKEIWGLEIEDQKKINLIDKCGEIEYRMIEGADEFIQLEALLANFLS